MPSEFSQIETIAIKDCLEKVKYNVIKVVTNPIETELEKLELENAGKDHIEELFVTVETEVNNKRGKIKRKPTLDKPIAEAPFGLEVHGNSNTTVGVSEGKEVNKIDAHIGNIAYIDALVKQIKTSDNKNIKKRIRDLEAYKELLEFSFQYLGKSADDIKQSSHESFKV